MVNPQSWVLALKPQRVKRSNSRRSLAADKKDRQRATAAAGGDGVWIPQSAAYPTKPESIFKDCCIDIKQGQMLSDPFEVLTVYVIKHHMQEFEDERDLCPFNTDLDNVQLVFKQQMTWFLFVRKDAETGTTIAEEFIKMNDVPKDIEKQIMLVTKMFHGQFEVVKRKGRNIVLYDMDTHKKYVVATNNPSLYFVGCIILGCIHPYEDRYKLCGVPTIAMPPK